MSILTKDIDLVPVWMAYQHSDAFVEDIVKELKRVNAKDQRSWVQIAVIIKDPDSVPGPQGNSRIEFVSVSLDRYDIYECDIDKYDYEDAAHQIRDRLLKKYPHDEIILESTKLRFRK